ncbi:glycosyltransferase [Marivita sp. S6314]|uniref:glycosyltransferase family 2 protein n=1 Tax=Marivita sp. S6314 TaxID=2926406 RepID=UPI0032B11EF5|nr:glycosyltransferase [Marivita sp. S6314]
MTPLSFSVIVVSRDRPRWLRRTLMAIDQLDYPRFEIRVVACRDGVSAARSFDLRRPVSVIAFDEANISKARNLGIAHANGDILAFIDDDAVPEPTWLQHLASAFDRPDIVQAGGTTLGRNGISVQHAASLADAFGRSHPVSVTSDTPAQIAPTQVGLPRLHGTNMAFRRTTLWDHKGFDERFTFYLEETDLTRRIAQQGGGTAYVPNAVVHHATAKSRHRTTTRTPVRLFEIGASAAVFHRKHAKSEEWHDAKACFFSERRSWLMWHMQIGTLTPDDVLRLLRELEDGYAEGLQRDAEAGLRKDAPPPMDVPAFAPSAKDICLLPGFASRTAARNVATQRVSRGDRVTVLEYSPSSLFHHVEFTMDGYWRHVGGIFGKEQRHEPLVQMATRQSRARRTLERLAGIRARNRLEIAGKLKLL